jgi:hypothetical protein
MRAQVLGTCRAVELNLHIQHIDTKALVRTKEPIRVMVLLRPYNPDNQGPKYWRSGLNIHVGIFFREM